MKNLTFINLDTFASMDRVRFPSIFRDIDGSRGYFLVQGRVAQRALHKS